MECHWIPPAELPHTTVLYRTFLNDFPRVSEFYSHPPTLDGVLRSAAEVQLGDMRLLSGGDPQTFGVAGKVQNNSPQYTLTEVQLQVVMQDCTELDCATIGEQVATVPTSIPAGEVRDIETQAHFEGMPEPQGKLGWRYSVVGTKASEPQ